MNAVMPLYRVGSGIYLYTYMYSVHVYNGMHTLDRDQTHSKILYNRA